ncbi:MAG TPA: chlorophyll synthase ChlG [Roseiflexaceae bacterium]|nr:chlorophyll synthase ChlG [Roseiflexaceae bacterium]HMP39164.1 chlorophyll synthase ChlG [Roseiflexaceae bacterium]
MREPVLTSTTTAGMVRPSMLGRSIALMKPITWFAPAWAWFCGSIASGATFWSVDSIGRLALGMFLAGPIVCGLSQVVNDYCDREVDAINEPQRLIPSGMVSTRQVFATIIALTILALGIALILGPAVTLLTAVGMLTALLYSANPVRAKRNGWIGSALVALSYEGLPWLAGHLSFAELTPMSLIMAALFSFGTHGIMTINDFKSIDGDRLSGIKTLPATYGPQLAAGMVVITMVTAQLFVIMTFAAWQRWIPMIIITGLLLGQIPLQRRFLRDPIPNAITFSAGASGLFVLGMLVTAIGIR